MYLDSFEDVICLLLQNHHQEVGWSVTYQLVGGVHPITGMTGSPEWFSGEMVGAPCRQVVYWAVWGAPAGLHPRCGRVGMLLRPGLQSLGRAS